MQSMMSACEYFRLEHSIWPKAQEEEFIIPLPKNPYFLYHGKSKGDYFQRMVNFHDDFPRL